MFINAIADSNIWTFKTSTSNFFSYFSTNTDSTRQPRQKTFVFLTPNSYLHDYINLVIPEGSAVTLDGITIPQSELVTVPGTTHRVYRTEVSDGVHIIESEKPAALTVYGYDAAVSYGYPGAMGLKNLVNP